MKKSTYRLNLLGLAGIIVFTAIMLLVACDEDEKIDYPNPSINIIVNPDFISSDTIISVGQIFTIGIHAEYNGYNNLTNFIAKVNGKRYLDIGIYAKKIDKEVEISKGLENVEEWEFIIRDIEGNTASTNITIYNNPNIIYGNIDEFLNVQLGAQNSSEFGSFFSLSTGTVYGLEDAYNSSELIDMVYYYDNFDKLEENIIASPGANIGETVFPGEFAISNWETVNTTRYSREKLDITIEEFDNATNDSILIAKSFAFESGGRKTKFLKPGDIFSFVKGNKTGIFKVVSTFGTSSGNIIVDIKIQK